MQEERDRVDEEGRCDLLREQWMSQHIRSDGSAERVSYDNNLVQVVGGEDLGDREAGGFSIERRASYPVGNREYLADGFITRENA